MVSNNEQAQSKNQTIITYCAMIAGIGLVWGIILTLFVLRDSVFSPSNVTQNTVPLVSTNEQFINDNTQARIDLNNINAVWHLVFSQLPDEVNVYPTENYYYFKFFDGGREIWGNIRLGVKDRQKKEVSFAYFSVVNRVEPPLRSMSVSKHTFFSEETGVELNEIDPLTHSITYLGKTVVFRLHDVPQSIPDGLQLREDEKFVSRTFDESGFQLALLFDDKNPAFRFVLDETAPLPDILVPVEENLLVGQRSGFAFYEDTVLNRKVLVGVDSKNISVNNYYDGPFDQLADNFVEGDTFKNYAIRAFPALEGKLSQRGEYLDKEGNLTSSRLGLQPLLKYYSLQHLQDFVHGCQKVSNAQQTIACLTRDDKYNK